MKKLLECLIAKIDVLSTQVNDLSNKVAVHIAVAKQTKDLTDAHEMCLNGDHKTTGIKTQIKVMWVLIGILIVVVLKDLASGVKLIPWAF